MLWPVFDLFSAQQPIRHCLSSPVPITLGINTPDSTQALRSHLTSIPGEHKPCSLVAEPWTWEQGHLGLNRGPTVCWVCHFAPFFPCLYSVNDKRFPPLSVDHEA